MQQIQSASGLQKHINPTNSPEIANIYAKSDELMIQKKRISNKITICSDWNQRT